ncbi:hypothetical protein J1N35_022830 [Gossypium stocksii]|uniref:Zinc knuckle CX2CX4HX4C domain-containing protein n=1 Tax=Gossypium stocksii TaxID=47602 RepID=A0A9D3VIL6_9ROSI|nr:hypothetical protein J1N35_022830 [Gossypium stocksii]
MENIVVLKLLGHNISFSVLQNKIYSLWKTLMPFQLIDTENGYFLAKFQNKMDCRKGSLIGKVAKLEMNTDSRIRGRFACMAVYVNFDKPLVSQVLINGKTQRVKYEFLPTVCFHYGRYGHVKEVCPFRVLEPSSGRTMPSSESSPEAVNMVDD